MGTVLLVTISLLVSALLHAEGVHAATFTVTTAQDAPDATPADGVCASTLPGGACTLRAAIQTANALGGAQAIQLAVAGTYLLTVTGAGEDAAASGDLDVNGGTLTLTNTSGGAVVIDGNAADRVFDVGPTSTAQLAIDGVTVRNGRVTGDGGGIRVGTGSSLTLSNATLSGNGAAGAAGGNVGGGSGRGGGVASFGTVTLANVTLSGNTAGGGTGGSSGGFGGNGGNGVGGGVANFGTATLTNVTLSGNTAAGASGITVQSGFGPLGGSGGSASGGGIYNAGSSLTLNSVTLSANTASGGSGADSGGAIFGSSGNTGGSGGSGRGGGVSNESSAVILTNVTLSGNSAQGG